MKGSGSSSPKGVTGDELSWDALAVQMKGCGCFPKCGSDLACIDSVAVGMFGAKVGADDGVRCVVGTGGDVADPTDDGFDGADGRGSGFMVDDRASLPILLVVNCEGGSSALLLEDCLREGGV